MNAALPSGNETALRFAASKNHPEIVKLLLHAGADPTVIDGHGRTPLSWAR